MILRSDSFKAGETIPGEFAFGVPDEANHVALAANRNPHLAWQNAPPGAKSFAITCIDVDVPTRADDVNQEGREIPSELPRTEFVHWLIVNIPGSQTEIAAGSCSDGVVPHGKSAPEGPPGSEQGVNDYTSWFAEDESMQGTWRGYDGPCPPWNDSIIHHYHFNVHALDTDDLGLSDDFELDELRRALEIHTLDSASLVGTYSLNPRLR